jgi:hypothetical protein
MKNVMDTQQHWRIESATPVSVGFTVRSPVARCSRKVTLYVLAPEPVTRTAVKPNAAAAAADATAATAAASPPAEGE